MGERDVAVPQNALDIFGDIPLTDYGVHLNRQIIEGVIARMTNNADATRMAFAAAHAQQGTIVYAEPNYAPALCVLGLVDAALGCKDQALREGRRAVELLPTGKDAINDPLMRAYFAMIAAWVGQKDLAYEQLAIAIRPPSTVS